MKKEERKSDVPVGSATRAGGLMLLLGLAAGAASFSLWGAREQSAQVGTATEPQGNVDARPSVASALAATPAASSGLRAVASATAMRLPADNPPPDSSKAGATSGSNSAPNPDAVSAEEGVAHPTPTERDAIYKPPTERDAIYERVTQHMRQQFLPLAEKCYEGLLERDDQASGVVEMELTVVGDESVGGIVERARLGDGTTFTNADFRTCITESSFTTEFDPPKGLDGKVTIVYPLRFAP
jgi:hypothetical protein